MISPNELREKAGRLFFRVIAGELNNQSLFPLVIPGNKKISGENYNAWRDDLVPLYQQSKQQRGSGYTVDWKERKVAGTNQQVPARIYFESIGDFLGFTCRKKDHDAIVSAYRLLTEAFPLVSDWAIANLNLLLVYRDEWPGILAVCRYFSAHKPPHPYYLRELPIEVHSKFIEQHQAVLRKLLDVLLPIDWYQAAEPDFSARYFLKSARVLAQIRILDDQLKPYLGYDDCALSLDDAAWLQWKPKKVFIVENKACFLSFPPVENAVALFGEGFKSRLSQRFGWIAEAELYCWFDLDAAGFEILNLVRQQYPHARSLMMDQQTFQQFSGFSVNNKHPKKALGYLNPEELAMYAYLQTGRLRLEQERIPQWFVREKLLPL